MTERGDTVIKNYDCDLDTMHHLYSLLYGGPRRGNIISYHIIWHISYEVIAIVSKKDLSVLFIDCIMLVMCFEFMFESSLSPLLLFLSSLPSLSPSSLPSSPPPPSSPFFPR